MLSIFLLVAFFYICSMQHLTKIFIFSFLAIAIVSCNVEDLEKYNGDFKGQWRTDIYYSPSKGDSIRNYLTIDGKDSGLGIACEKDDPFVHCLSFQTGKAKYNKASRGLQIGNSVQHVPYVDKEPFINNDGKWEIVLDNVSYYKY